MAMILDYLTGHEIAAGIQGCFASDEAIKAAERAADRRGNDVLLIDDDGEWRVHPRIGSTRKPADFIEDLG